MRSAVLLLASVVFVSGCTLTTSLDGIFADGADASLVPDVSRPDGDPNDGEGLIFPTDPPPCGASKEPCCDGKCNAGLLCTGTACVEPPPCGAEGQSCCNGSACNPALECKSGKCSTTPTPPACGGDGQTCCSGGACIGGLVCTPGTGGKCVACGRNGQPCCGGASCSGGHVCSSGTCMSCGGKDQPCCIGSICGGGLGCSGTKCRPLCYLRCCDNSLHTRTVADATECRNSYAVCADRGKTLRIQYEGVYLYVRDTKC